MAYYNSYITGVGFTPRKTSMSMEKQPFEDASPIKNCASPLPSWFRRNNH